MKSSIDLLKLKTDFEDNQTYETVTIEESVLTPTKSLVTFMAQDKNQQRINLFSFIQTNQYFPICFISPRYTKTYGEKDRELLIADIKDTLQERINLLHYYTGK